MRHQDAAPIHDRECNGRPKHAEPEPLNLIAAAPYNSPWLAASIAVAGSSAPIRTLRQWMMPAPQADYSRGPLSTVSHWVIVAERRDTQLKQHSHRGPYIEGF